ncbi:fimbrial protein [Rahnella selenatireducens]|uniref:fimbrial protein n=1 Tax=Rahnella selenatireducens TaxID=3389797 RepID=UPI0039688979
MKLFLLFLLFFNFNCFAKCSSPGGDHTFSFGKVIVQRDAPVGTKIAQTDIPFPGYVSGDSTTDLCYLHGIMLYLGASESDIKGVFKTNLDGVGIELYMATNNGGGDMTPYPGTPMGGFPGGGAYGLYYNYFSLIKIGKITSGSLSAGLAGKVTMDHQGEENIGEVLTISLLGDTTVTALACSIDTPSLTFQIPDVSANEFSSTIGFSPAQKKTMDLKLTCDLGANINVVLNGTQNPDTSDTSVLAIDGQSGDSHTEGAADGIGVQLLYNDKPLKINENIVLKKSDSESESFPITARYYQTKNLVKPGLINSTSTLTLTYQ